MSGGEDAGAKRPAKTNSQRAPDTQRERERGDCASIYEVSLRDGIQRHATFIPTGEKLKLLHALRGAGLDRFELTSFVSRRAIPQLADAEALIGDLGQNAPGLLERSSALVINERGYNRAAAAGV